MATKKTPKTPAPATPFIDGYKDLAAGLCEPSWDGPGQFLPDDYNILFSEYRALPTKRELDQARKWIVGCNEEYQDFLTAYDYLLAHKKEIAAEQKALAKHQDSNKCTACGQRI
jgi:hypothetical protein